MGARRVLIGTTLTLVALLVAVTVVLGVRNGTFSDDPFTLLSVAALATYAGVGAFLALRLPRNPIGWLFLVAGLGILWGGAGSEYAKYTLATDPGALPFGTAAAWINNWAFIEVGAHFIRS